MTLQYLLIQTVLMNRQKKTNNDILTKLKLFTSSSQLSSLFDILVITHTFKGFSTSA